MRILTDAFRNVDGCMYCRRKIQSHVDLSSAFGGVANVTLSRLARRANRVDFAYTVNPLYNDTVCSKLSLTLK